MNKTCPKCNKTLPKDQFTVDRRNPGGLSVYCRPCSKEYRDAYRSRDTEEYRISQKTSRGKILGGYRKRNSAPGWEYPDQKTCARCLETFAGTNFHRQSNSIDGVSPYCKECVSAMNRRSNLKRLYGMTEHDFYSMLDRQNHLCAICDIALVGIKMNLDHDHKSGKPRGILCSNCNIGLGNFKDSVELLSSAQRYLAG